MSRTVAFLLLIVAVVAAQSNEQGKQCGPNEQYDSCGSDCEPSCDEPSPRACTLSCKMGCFCKEGYVKNSEGKCVLTRDC